MRFDGRDAVAALFALAYLAFLIVLTFSILSAIGSRGAEVRRDVIRAH